MPIPSMPSIPYVIKKKLEQIKADVTALQNAPPGSGDMMRSVYDADLDGKIANAQLTSGTDIADAITKKHSNTLDHNGATQDSAISGKANSTHSHATTDITGTAVITNDARLSDARTPLTHSHAPGDTTGTAVVTNDARLSDARTPLTHTHSYEPANANIQTHVTAAHAPSNAQANADITKAEIEAKLTGTISSHSHSGGSSPSWYGVLYSNQNDCNPNEVFREWNMLAVAGPTPTGITVSLARAVMFTPPANMTCIKVRLFGVGITTNCYKFGIYPVGTGSAKLWDSGTVTTAANTWLNTVTNFALTAGTQYWFCVTAVATGTVAGFRSGPAPLGTTFWGANAAPIGNRVLSIPVFAQFAVSTGVFPATLPVVAAAAYSNGTTGSVPFALLDSVA